MTNLGIEVIGVSENCNGNIFNNGITYEVEVDGITIDWDFQGTPEELQMELDTGKHDKDINEIIEFMLA